MVAAPALLAAALASSRMGMTAGLESGAVVAVVALGLLLSAPPLKAEEQPAPAALPVAHPLMPERQAVLDTLQPAVNPSATLHEFIRMIAKAVDERTSYLRGHSDRVARYSVMIAAELRLPPAQIERIRLSALLHDLGTIGIDDSVITKDAPLTPEEFEILKAHTVKGAAILRPIEALQDLIPGVELHHESLDGSGYPYGLKRDEIPMMARIITVADSFDAMTTDRPYQTSMDPEYVLEVMNRLAGTRYDESAVAALTQLVMDGTIRIEPRRDRRSAAFV